MIDMETGEISDVVKPFVRSPYNYNMNTAGDESALHCTMPTMAQQQFKEECDINTIVRNFGVTGTLPENIRMPVSGDFTDAVTDYQTAINMVFEAEEAFMQLPSATRERFANDPQRLIDFLENPANKDEAKKLGLLVPDPVVPEPTRVFVANAADLAPKGASGPVST